MRMPVCTVPAVNTVPAQWEIREKAEFCLWGNLESSEDNKTYKLETKRSINTLKVDSRNLHRKPYMKPDSSNSEGWNGGNRGQESVPCDYRNGTCDWD